MDLMLGVEQTPAKSLVFTIKFLFSEEITGADGARKCDDVIPHKLHRHTTIKEKSVVK